MKLKFISKRLLFALFIFICSLYVMLSFGKVPTVHAASEDGYLYSCQDFVINKIYNNGTDSYLEVRSKLRNGSQYAEHLDFVEMSVGDYNDNFNFKTFSLTLLNGTTSEYYYGGVEIYSIDNLCDEENMFHGYVSYLKNSDNQFWYLSDIDNPIDITYFPYKTLKWAEAYAYIYFTDKTATPVIFNYYNSAYIFFNLYVDGVGEIDPSNVKSIKFQFKDKKNEWVIINSSFALSLSDFDFPIDGDSWSINFLEGFSNHHTIYLDEDVNIFKCEEPTNSNNLSNKFEAHLMSCSNSITSDILDDAIENYAFSDWNENYINFKYLINLEHCPRLNKGATKNNNTINSFQVLQFSYYDETGLLTGASLYDGDKPIYTIHDDLTNEDVPYTLDDNGDMVVDTEHYVDEFGNVRNIDDDSIVGAGDRNHDKSNVPNDSFWDKIGSFFGSFGSAFKRVTTIVLLVIGIILVIKIISLFKGIFGKKDNNVNINVRSSSGKSKRRRK